VQISLTVKGKLFIFKPALEAAAPETTEERKDIRKSRTGRVREAGTIGLF